MLISVYLNIFAEKTLQQDIHHTLRTGLKYLNPETLTTIINSVQLRLSRPRRRTAPHEMIQFPVITVLYLKWQLRPVKCKRWNLLWNASWSLKRNVLKPWKFLFVSIWGKIIMSEICVTVAMANCSNCRIMTHVLTYFNNIVTLNQSYACSNKLWTQY